MNNQDSFSEKFVRLLEEWSEHCRVGPAGPNGPLVAELLKSTARVEELRRGLKDIHSNLHPLRNKSAPVCGALARIEALIPELKEIEYA